MSFRVQVDVTNPGQFFACCGLFELASRLDPGSLAHFELGAFAVTCEPALDTVLTRLVAAGLAQVDPDDDTASPIDIGPPFGLRLDWWKDEETGGRDLKVWAGSMQSVRIAQAMVAALRDPSLHTEALLDIGQIVYDPAEPAKKVEPFYFDARRASNAHSRDIGFSPNDLELTTTAFPAVEALCLIGLQRCRPSLTGQRRVYDYRTWDSPVPTSIVAAIIAGAVPMQGARIYRFEVWYRTGQKKHKAFRAAVHVAQGE
jgi:CRISPR-associated protein Csb3